MKRLLVSMLALSVCAIELRGQMNESAQTPSELLRVIEAGHPHEIALRITVDEMSLDEYWTSTFDSIFAFADVDSDGLLNEDELRLIPSARAVRLSLGTGFTPPVATILSLNEIVATESPTCSKDALGKYYRRHGVGRVTFGTGQLPHTAALTQAIVQSLDQDRDGTISEAELSKAEVVLRRRDANDDELIGVGEFVPNVSYPGQWAANPLATSANIDISTLGDGSLRLLRGQKLASDAAGDTSGQLTDWSIAIADRIKVSPLELVTKTRGVVWSVPGPLSALNSALGEELANADAEPSTEPEGNRNRGRRASRAWLTPLVDRDRNGMASQEEIDRWLALQRQIIRGQLLISIYHDGGLFEMLDANHDAALSVRELRTAWQTLKIASCTSEDRVDLDRIPNVLLLIVSQGYPDSLASTTTTSVEWFRRMDRNSDGDVSRREFTGSPDAFRRLDQDRDELLSPREAESPTAELNP